MAAAVQEIIKPLVLSNDQVIYLSSRLKNYNQKVKTINGVNFAPYAYLCNKDVFTIKIENDIVQYDFVGQVNLSTLGGHNFFGLPVDTSFFETHESDFQKTGKFLIKKPKNISFYGYEIIEINDEPLNLTMKQEDIISIEDSQDSNDLMEIDTIDEQQYAIDEAAIDNILRANGINPQDGSNDDFIYDYDCK